MQLLTKTERKDLRHVLLGIPGATRVLFEETAEGTWLAEVEETLIFEAGTLGDLLREIISAVEES